MKVKYQVNFKDEAGFKTEYYSYSELNEKFNIVGFNKNQSNRKELQGEPKIQGFLGPMYNGYENDILIIRYETQEIYNSLSY
ncbi:hypothetical protein Q7A53_05865 [Halobacillus rhizosphaerae]|uniref:hypothetical protein n=1 Tax=Halobacillus rhizosphaerae TaxID=3064889 RepID=UPI00398B5893